MLHREQRTWPTCSDFRLGSSAAAARSKPVAISWRPFPGCEFEECGHSGDRRLDTVQERALITTLCSINVHEQSAARSRSAVAAGAAAGRTRADAGVLDAHVGGVIGPEEQGGPQQRRGGQRPARRGEPYAARRGPIIGQAADPLLDARTGPEQGVGTDKTRPLPAGERSLEAPHLYQRSGSGFCSTSTTSSSQESSRRKTALGQAAARPRLPRIGMAPREWRALRRIPCVKSTVELPILTELRDILLKARQDLLRA